jgi:superfamily I DNA and/or RNA helicase
MIALMEAGDAESAAILTPYNGQVRLIRRILKEHTGDLYQKVLPCSIHVLPK